jgi:hypothetical protein
VLYPIVKLTASSLVKYVPGDLDMVFQLKASFERLVKSLSSQYLTEVTGQSQATALFFEWTVNEMKLG